MDSVDELAARRDRLEKDLDRVTRRIEILSTIPDEPLFEDGEPTVIWFNRKFHPHSDIYTYASVRAGDGLWYSTGPTAPKGYTWEKLYQWIVQDTHATIWVATTWEQL